MKPLFIFRFFIETLFVRERLIGFYWLAARLGFFLVQVYTVLGVNGDYWNFLLRVILRGWSG